MSESTIFTYGGGILLEQIFSSISHLMYAVKGNSIIFTLSYVIALIGGFWAFSKIFFSSFNLFLSRYFIPLLIIPVFLMIPKSTLHIEDKITNQKFIVNDVPFSLAKFAQFTSSIGHHLSSALECVFKLVNKNISPKLCLGIDSSLDVNRYQILNTNLEKNLRSFSRQCVLYDAALKRYSIEDLKKTNDIWNFLKKNSSKVRMIHYDPIDEKDDDNHLLQTGSYLNCQAALAKMDPNFNKEVAFYEKMHFTQNLPDSFKALSGKDKTSKELIPQLLMMNLLGTEFSGKDFANYRKYLKENNAFFSIGSLIASSLMTIRSVLEAFIYISFVIILPLFFLPAGIKILFSWMWLLVWVQLWPLFFNIINFILQIYMQNRVITSFGSNGILDGDFGINFFTAGSLQNINEDIYAISGFLLVCVPFFSYFLLKSLIQSSLSHFDFFVSGNIEGFTENSSPHETFSTASHTSYSSSSQQNGFPVPDSYFSSSHISSNYQKSSMNPHEDMSEKASSSVQNFNLHEQNNGSSVNLTESRETQYEIYQKHLNSFESHKFENRVSELLSAQNSLDFQKKYSQDILDYSSSKQIQYKNSSEPEFIEVLPILPEELEYKHSMFSNRQNSMIDTMNAMSFSKKFEHERNS